MPPRSVPARDLRTATELEAEATRLADAVARRLRTSNLQARTVTLKLRFGDFKTITRSVTLPDPTDGTRDLMAAARWLLAQIDVALWTGAVQTAPASQRGAHPR